MDVFEAIARRYSHKAAFAAEPVPNEQLVRIAQAGMAAPSGNNRQTSEFILINDPAVLAEIGHITRHKPLASAPAMIAIVSDTAQSLPGTTFYIEDYAAATENILLAATALGYACGWIDYLLRAPEMDQPICELLGIPADRALMVIIPIGKPAEVAKRRTKKPFEERCSWNRYAVRRTPSSGE
ncbi:MAG: nitroreductase family protein [Chloroflexi bacterium]|nr:nitroreductase family protein [Chloroflexota bacterium]